MKARALNIYTETQIHFQFQRVSFSHDTTLDFVVSFFSFNRGSKTNLYTWFSCSGYVIARKIKRSSLIPTGPNSTVLEYDFTVSKWLWFFCEEEFVKNERIY